MSGALADYQEGLSIARALLKANPDDEQAKLSLAQSLENVADAKSKIGDKDGAVAARDEALLLRKVLAEKVQDDGNVDAKIELVRSLYKLAEIAAGDKKDTAIDQGISLARRSRR